MQRAKFCTEIVKFCTERAKFCTERAKFCTEIANFCTEIAKLYAERAKFCVEFCAEKEGANIQLLNKIPDCLSLGEDVPSLSKCFTWSVAIISFLKGSIVLSTEDHLLSS